MFFFSSRRRHTRWTGDWSSDVCSSDLFSRHAFFDAPRLDAMLALAMVRARLARPQHYEERSIATGGLAIDRRDDYVELLQRADEQPVTILAFLARHAHSGSQRIPSHQTAQLRDWPGVEFSLHRELPHDFRPGDLRRQSVCHRHYRVPH